MSEAFDEEFIDQLPADPYHAFDEIIERYRSAIVDPGNSASDKFSIACQAYFLAKEYTKAYVPALAELFQRQLNLDNPAKALQQVDAQFSKASQHAETAAVKESVEAIEFRAKALIDKVHSIEFTEGDLTRLQALLDQMRTVTTDSKEISHRFKKRILAKLVKLQAALHKRTTSVDDFWTLLPEAGLALGRFGENARPLVELVNETLRIVWRNQARQAQLPSGSQPDFLPAPDSDSAVDDDDAGDG